MRAPSPLSREELLACVELGKAITAELEADRLLGVILQKVSCLIPASNWSLLLADETTGELRFEVVVGLDPALLQTVRLKPGEGVAGQVALNQRPLMVRDVHECPHFNPDVDRRSGFQTRSILCVPLVFGGSTLGVIEAVNPDRLDDGALALLTVIADYAAIAVENTRRFRRMQEMAIRDNLTGLYNTRYLYHRLREQLQEREDCNREPFSLIFIDMDDFKRVVDTYGHLNGSRALQEVAATIRETLSESAYGVSYGGDEFVIVLPGFSKEDAVGKAEELRTRFSETVYLTRWGHRVSLRASFGVATCPDDACDLDGLLSLADRAMFRVKRHGKDAVGADEPDLEKTPLET